MTCACHSIPQNRIECDSCGRLGYFLESVYPEKITSICKACNGVGHKAQ